MPPDKWYNTFLFSPCEWSIWTHDNETKRKKTNVLRTFFLTGIVVIVVHIPSSVLSFFFYSYIRVQVITLAGAAATAAVEIVSAVSQHT
jgi:uncharacterized membrane protein YdbT with pleckstrin-like domain